MLAEREAEKERECVSSMFRENVSRGMYSQLRGGARYIRRVLTRVIDKSLISDLLVRRTVVARDNEGAVARSNVYDRWISVVEGGSPLISPPMAKRAHALRRDEYRN